MRFLLLSVLVMLFLSGCINLPATPADEIENEPVCKMVNKETPVTRYECQNYSKTTTVCDERPMKYTVLSLTKNTLCTSDGICTGKPIDQCSECSRAMTRCILTVQSNENKTSGTITVDANFTFVNAAFMKEPVSQTIKPGASAAFDFFQIYNPGTPINTADCILVVAGNPEIEECNDITKTETECQQVTKMETTQVQVCN